ncbi:MAG: glycine/sarcosine/betaine reductase selenoprotein B family protein [Vulcanimicrobiaceae bacterium]
MPLELARRAIPYTPFDRKLADTTVALVSTAGVHLKSHEPFDVDGDGSYRIIPSDVDVADLTITHGHYDHSAGDRDVNSVFPIERLREMVADGTLKGLHPEAYGMMGYTLKLKQVLDETAPEIARKVERSSTDLVLLTGG